MAATAARRAEPWRDNRVSMVFNREHNFLRIEPDAYRFRPRGWLEPLQHLAWWLLTRSGAMKRHTVEERYFTQISIDGDRAMDRIFKARGELFQLGRRPEKVMLGVEDMAEIMDDPKFRDMMHFNQPVNFEGRVGFDQSVYGLPVEIVPHMRGVLVL